MISMISMNLILMKTSYFWIAKKNAVALRRQSVETVRDWELWRAVIARIAHLWLINLLVFAQAQSFFFDRGDKCSTLNRFKNIKYKKTKNEN